jgi:hypothetical protein
MSPAYGSQKLQVFDRNERPDYLDSFTMSCIFYEVQPIDDTGATLMSKDKSNVEPSRETDNVDQGITEPTNEQNEDVGPSADAVFDDLLNEETIGNNQDTMEPKIEDSGAEDDTFQHEQDTIKVKIEDTSVSVGADEDDRFDEGTTQDEHIQQNLNTLRAATATRHSAFTPFSKMFSPY